MVQFHFQSVNLVRVLPVRTMGLKLRKLGKPNFKADGLNDKWASNRHKWDPIARHSTHVGELLSTKALN